MLLVACFVLCLVTTVMQSEDTNYETDDKLASFTDNQKKLFGSLSNVRSIASDDDQKQLSGSSQNSASTNNDQNQALSSSQNTNNNFGQQPPPPPTLLPTQPPTEPPTHPPAPSVPPQPNFKWNTPKNYALSSFKNPMVQLVGGIGLITISYRIFKRLQNDETLNKTLRDFHVEAITKPKTSPMHRMLFAGLVVVVVLGLYLVYRIVVYLIRRPNDDRIEDGSKEAGGGTGQTTSDAMSPSVTSTQVSASTPTIKETQQATPFVPWEGYGERDSSFCNKWALPGMVASPTSPTSGLTPVKNLKRTQESLSPVMQPNKRARSTDRPSSSNASPSATGHDTNPEHSLSGPQKAYRSTG